MAPSITSSPTRASVRRRVVTFVAGLLALCGLLAVAPSSPSTAVGPYCQLGGLTANRWTGAGDGISWVDPGNWTLGVPDNTQRASGYVCIDLTTTTGRVVEIRAGEHAELQALDVEAGMTLRLALGSKIFVFGDQVTRPSVVRQGAVVEVLGASYGGSGRTDVLGTFRWRSLTTGAATLISDPCMLGVGAGTPPPGCPGVGPGLLEVGDTGVLAVDGRGVNLFDRFRIVVRGVMRLTATAYVAADHGTAIELRPKLTTTGAGTFDIRNNGGVLEGFGRGIASPATFVNEGILVKQGTAATGTSLIDATYVDAGGQVRVFAGTLLIPSGTARPATVRGGFTWGSGTCDPGSAYGCAPDTTTADRQTGRFQVPAADSAGAAVIVQETTTTSTTQDIGFPVRAHATGLAATRTAPAVISLRYDSSLLGGRGWQQVQVYRQPTTTQPYGLLGPCLSDGAVPATRIACVDRRGLAVSSRNVADAEGAGTAPDVVMVVRTIQTSRWVAR